ncbi:N-acetylglucosaminyl-diphospho-decaprenol L-rhamnosyltransferase [bacterium BMS3Abin15]|nr:N-acetylglucosaminyl-diphospho-decaprenol L-rhamnosyltransferase [bacterium BMS3Abin15]
MNWLGKSRELITITKMQNEITLSIIIVNYKSERYIEKCIVSIREKIKDLSFEIIVVNNDESDIEFDNVKIINSGENVGFGRANNLGAKEARGKYLLFLNPDTLLLTENIKKVVEEFENNEKIGMVGPRLLTIKNETQRWCAGAESSLLNLIRNNFGATKSKKIWESKEKTRADWVSGAAMFIKKELFYRLSGFDEKFFMYFEDEDLCKRVRSTGYKIIYFPEVEIKHLGGKSFENKTLKDSNLTCKTKSSEAFLSVKALASAEAKEGKKAQKNYFYASQDYYFQKHFGKLTSWIVKFLRKVFK